MSSSLQSLSFNHLPDFCAIFVPSIWSSNKPFRLSTTFRIFCHKLLRTTQISTACALLALLYIHRLRSAYPTIQASIGSEVRLFTTALILANKFLDDNTFTHKTWSDVSGIPVGELNIMEIEFLSALDYTIYVHHTQFFAWVAQCQSYSCTSLSMSIPAAVTTTNTAFSASAAATAAATATATATATAILTTTKNLKRSAAAMTAPYRRLPSKRQHLQKHHVPRTPPDETFSRQPPTIIASVIQPRQQQQQQPVLSWSSSSSAVASSRHAATPSTIASFVVASPMPFTSAAPTMIYPSVLASRIQCLD